MRAHPPGAPAVQVFSFVFGDGDPNDGLDEVRWKAVRPKGPVPTHRACLGYNCWQEWVRAVRPEPHGIVA